MEDEIVFMSAYNATSFSKSMHFFKQKPQLNILFKKYHIDYIIYKDKLLSHKGALTLDMEYDYVRQQTAFSYNPINKKHDIKEYEAIIKNTGFYIKLLHAQSVLADSSYFKIDYFLCMDPFLVYLMIIFFKSTQLYFQ